MDKKTIVIFNSQCMGDALLGTHSARFIKTLYPNSNIVFLIREDMTLTTAETDKNGINEVLDILELQDYIDDVGVVNHLGHGQTRKNYLVNTNIDKIYEQHGWFSDLGLVKSSLVGIAEDVGWNNVNTETRFSVGEEITKKDRFTIATAGPLDWNRKIGNHLKLEVIFDYIKSKIPNADIVSLGRDVSKNTYLESLKILKSCHLYLGPIGSMTIAAAGFGLDTINICSVFPPTFDSPEFYHSGNHHSVTASLSNHCGNYNCITQAYYKKGLKKIGNPRTEWSFWTKECNYREDKKSCITNITENNILEKVETWLIQSNLKIK